MNTRFALIIVLAVAVCSVSSQACQPVAEKTADGGTTKEPAAPAHATPADPVAPGEAPVEPGAEVGTEAPATDRLVAQSIADGLMAAWKRDNPSVDWEAEERKSRTFVPPFDNSALLAEPSQANGHPYRRWTQQDLLLWKRETEKAVAAGSRVFHSADLLGSTNGVSCDMCHPNAANTHPETYPKYQTQMGRVVLLRDMINWCLINPLRAQPIAADDERMRALEAYITSQRSGTPMAYGKH